jgi:putative spermidine/putrescine transport system substrate-binding protein
MHLAGRRARVMLSLLVLAVAAAGCGGDDGDDEANAGGGGGREVESDTVVFADYGGTTRTARSEAFLTPFSNEFGVRPVFADADPAKLALFAEQESAEWDLIDLDSWDVVRFSEQGLLAKLPKDVTRADLVPKEYQPYASGGYNASVGYGFQTEEGADGPQNWADFYDLEKFPGKRALPNFAYFQAESALLADGVACEDLYPLDLDRAFAKLDEIRDDLLFYDSFGQGVQYLAQDSVSMALLPNSRVQILKDQEFPVDFQWQDAFWQWTAAAVPKHAPHPDAAFAVVDFMSQPENQAQMARLTKYGPMNSAAEKLLDEETLEQLPNSHLDAACEVDNAGLAANLEEYSARFTEWLAQD